MLQLFLRMLGVLAFFGTLSILAVGAIAIVVGLVTGRPKVVASAAAVVGGWVILYVAAVVLGPALTPRRTLALGDELAFCGFDCHLHLAVIGVKSDSGLTVTLRIWSDARQEPEYPQYLQFRLIGADGALLAPENEARAFLRPLEAGQSYVDSLYFAASPTAFPYALRVVYPGPIDALLFGPASSWATGKTTLALGEIPK